MNPVRAGLSTTAQDYRWSSCRLYWSPEPRRSFVDNSFVLRLLAAEEGHAKYLYRRMLDRSIKTDDVMEETGAIERFRAKLTSMFPNIFTRVSEKGQVAELSGTNLVDMEDLEHQIQAVNEGKTGYIPTTRDAKKFFAEQLIARGFKRAEIAEKLNISIKTVYNLLNKST